jgi:putative transposase
MTDAITEERRTGTPVAMLCLLAQIPRSRYYRELKRVQPLPDSEEMRLRDLIQEICVESSCYGYRRVAAELHRKGHRINHKRVLALMRKDNLLCLRKKKHWIATTDSRHGLRVYPNLASEITVTDLNQLWVADITYIRLRYEFVFLAAILDVFSRKAIGWALSWQLDTSLTVAALLMALRGRVIKPGLVHHSDRGVQYASSEYTDILKSHGIAISMSRKGNPYDNAIAESFMKTLKTEEVYLNEYDSFSSANQNLGRFIEMVYNKKRLHSSLRYRPPEEFESLIQTQKASHQFA